VFYVVDRWFVSKFERRHGETAAHPAE
jgi:hypothetical protein